MNIRYLLLTLNSVLTCGLIGCNAGTAQVSPQQTQSASINNNQLQSGVADRRVNVVFRNGTNIPLRLKVSDVSCLNDQGSISGKILAPGEARDWAIKSDSSYSCIYKKSSGTFKLYKDTSDTKIGSVDFNISSIAGKNSISKNVDLSGYKIEIAEYENKLDSHDTMVISVSNSSTTLYENWMKNISSQLQGKALNRIILPGSHDSATKNIDTKYGDFYSIDALTTILGALNAVTNAGNWAKAQTSDITEQLNGGLRYFDLRATETKSQIEVSTKNKVLMKSPVNAASPDLFLHHTFLVSGKFQSALAVVDSAAKFALAHPSEIVILHFQNVKVANAVTLKSFMEAVYQKYSSVIASAQTLNPSSKYEEFIGHNLILIAPDDWSDPQLPWLWSSDKTLKTYWANQTPGNESKIFKYADQKLLKRPTNKLVVTQLQSTPDSEYLLSRKLYSNLTTVGYDAKKAEYDYLISSSTFANNGNIFIDDSSAPYQETMLASRLNSLR